MTDPGRSRPPGLSVRVKLTLSYAGFLLVAGVALFAVGFLLLRFVPDANIQDLSGLFVPNRSDLMEVFVRYAWWALIALLAFGLAGGWVLAGFVLRPLGRITEVARRARDGSLGSRIRLPGRRDELTDLADAFDALLERVQHTIDEERRFAANASHELRTPHTIVRTLVEVAQADPAGRDVDLLLARIGETNDRAIATTEALLSLARVGRGDALERERVDLAAIAAEAVTDVAADATAADVRIDTALSPAAVTGNATLLARLAGNLVHNAVIHNGTGGRVRVTTMDAPGGASLEVVNTGAVIDPAVAATLTEPFVRGAGRARGSDGPQGSGLGLALVAAIVHAHRGTLEVIARREGGLHVRVTLPR
ncbi:MULTISPECIES: sensor histidine kinase [Microbacterium]|uniref:histidine kinase n=1 Tax=Microbacterium wangchenii TaxID=2541726 RepID=A0ABX5SQT8_9MICO|nr:MULTISPECIES: HAMP domain-containing sensor histidine kinase [Microbacterium]MCK6065048.1 HAMP domain-containing histidine kinase [Microbacterium sp. EYE_512]QBR88515.1 HAMP domain-containing histidine kinase [Microbacterium wangchenii]TFV82430.1 HAMP domain-containing histidine kinase [Microbacterium sp. dk485]TXK20242.1 HAMP domain-containing histidine kinase [Microbacterium wangchenii]